MPQIPKKVGDLIRLDAPAPAACTALGLGTGNAAVFASVAGAGSGLTSLNGSAVATGTVAQARLPAPGTTTGTFADGGTVATNTANISSNTSAIALRELTSNKGTANGYAPLDGTSKVPAANLPSAIVNGLEFSGLWNASTNSPALASGTGTKGSIYKVSTTGTTTLDGLSQWNAGDFAFFDGTTWDKIDGLASEVISVAGRTGNVVLAESDITNLTTDLAAKVTGVTLNTSGLLHTTPTIAVVSGGTATLTQSLATQTANTILAGPTTGSPAAPTMRALVAADIPALDGSKITTGTVLQANLPAPGTTTGTYGDGGLLALKAPLASPTFTGQVGIGTTAAYPVDVLGSAAGIGDVRVNVKNSDVTGYGSVSVFAGTVGAVFRAYGSSFSDGSLAGNAAFGASGANGLVIFTNASNGSGSTGFLSIRGGGYSGAAEKLYVDQTGSKFTGQVGIGSIVATAMLNVVSSAATNKCLVLQGTTSQTAPLATFQGISSTSTARDMAVVDATWATSTDASRKGRLKLYAADSTGTNREGVRIESDGSQPLLGFYGAAAVAKPVLSYSRSGAGETAADAAIRSALASLGLITDSTIA